MGTITQLSFSQSCYALWICLLLIPMHLCGVNSTPRRWDPQGFDKTSKWAKASAYEVLATIEWRGKESLLDIGTGDGKIAAFISTKIPEGRVLAIDPSNEMLAFAQKHYPPSQFHNLRFQQGDALSFQTDEHFDIITSFTAMHMVTDQQKAVSNFAKMLKPKGRLYLKFPIEDGFAGALQKTMLMPQWRDYFVGYHDGWYFRTKNDYQQYVTKAGLIEVNIERVILDECYDSQEELTAAVCYWLPHILVLPSDKQQQFLNEMITLFLKVVPPDSHGKVHHFEPTLVVEAYKPESK